MFTHLAGREARRAWRAWAVAMGVTVLLAGCGAGGGGSTASGGPSGGTATNGTTQGSGCTAGTFVVNGISTRQFCGSAKAQATVSGQAETWSGGECFSGEAGMAGVNIGRTILDPSNSAAGQALKQQYDYFGVSAPATADGTVNGAISGVYHGSQFSSTGTITFTNQLHAGSFSGTTILGGGAISGSWTC